MGVRSTVPMAGTYVKRYRDGDVDMSHLAQQVDCDWKRFKNFPIMPSGNEYFLHT